MPARTATRCARLVVVAGGAIFATLAVVKLGACAYNDRVVGLCAFAVVVVGAIIALGGTGMATGGDRVRDRSLARRGLRFQWTVRVADAGDDRDVKLEGAASPVGHELSGPFSGRACVGYEVTVFDLDPVRPRLLARDVVLQPFLLRDPSGTAHVVPEPARVCILPDKQWRVDAARPHSTLSERAQQILARHGIILAGHTLLVCEGVLAVGDRVAVFGHVTREPDPESSALYRQLSTRPRLQGSPSAPLLVAPSVEL